MFAHRRVPLYFFFLDLGPGFSVPLNLRALSISAFVHSRMVALATPIGFGAEILLAAIHA